MSLDKKLESMVYLLDDTDESIYNQIANDLIEMGPPIIPTLENTWELSENELQKDRLSVILKKIRFDTLMEKFVMWSQIDHKNLQKGVELVVEFGYPNLDNTFINKEIENLKKEVWLELKYEMTPIEKVNLLNKVLFDKNKFVGDDKEYYKVNNSYINRVFERRKGNPISLAVIYSMVAQKLGIPIFGVNLPQHFVLAYLDINFGVQPISLQENGYLVIEEYGAPLFYINAFRKGQTFDKKELSNFLEKQKIKKDESFYIPCSNVAIIKRMLRNMVYSYTKAGKMLEVEQLNIIIGGL